MQSPTSLVYRLLCVVAAATAFLSRKHGLSLLKIGWLNLPWIDLTNLSPKLHDENLTNTYFCLDCACRIFDLSYWYIKKTNLDDV